jgi:hypothetical protein
LLLAASAAGAGGAAALLVFRHPGWAGAVALVGAVALSWGVVVAADHADDRSRLAARVADPVFDACLLAAIAWTARHSSTRVAVLALVSMGAAYVAAYERARAESLGYRGVESPGYRATRSALLVAGLLFGLVEPALWAFAALATAALVARAANVAVQEKRQRPADPGAS